MRPRFIKSRRHRRDQEQQQRIVSRRSDNDYRPSTPTPVSMVGIPRPSQVNRHPDGHSPELRPSRTRCHRGLYPCNNGYWLGWKR